MAISAFVLLHVGRGQTIRGDALGYAARLADEPLGHALLHPPPDKYLVAAPLLLYDAMFNVFGLGADLPYRLVVTTLVLLCGGLFFVIARRRVGSWLALPPTILLLFFGSGWETVLTPLRIPSLLALASGLGVLIALERRDRRGDVTAAILLTVSVASHPVGLAFLAAALVLVALRSSPQRWTSAWTVAIPAALFGAWWLFLRAPTTPSLVPTRPIDVVRFVADSWTTLTATVAGLAGVIGQPSFDQTSARLAAAALAVLVVGAVATRPRRVPPSLWAALAALVVLFAATRLAPSGFLRTPDEVRYLYPEGVLFLLVITELVGLMRIRGWAALVALGGVLALGLVYNINQLRDGAATARAESKAAVGQYTDYEFAGTALRRGYQPNSFSPTAGDYAAAAAAYGSAADSPAELEQASVPVRRAADAALAGSLGIALRPGAPPARAAAKSPKVERVLWGRAVRRPGCVRLLPHRTGGSMPKMIPLGPTPSPNLFLRETPKGEPVPPAPLVPELAELVPSSGGLRLGPKASRIAVLLGRFAPPPSAELDRSHLDAGATLRLPADGPAPHWTVTVASLAPVTVCGLRAG